MWTSFRYSLLLLLIIISSQNIAYSDVVSLDSNYVAGQTDLVTKLNNDRTALVNGVNNVRGCVAGGVQTAGQIKADTVCEENLADDANPRLRTYEGASCSDFVYSGFLMSSYSGLTGTVPTGIAYPEGYRVEKTSSTSKLFTANKWTYVYILNSGSLDYQEVAIDANRPSDPSNSAPLFRVSTDASGIIAIQDLRKTTCASGPFEAIADVTGEATLDDLLTNGAYVRRFSQAGRTPMGFAQGAFLSWDTTTTFKVTPGCLNINGKFRCVSTDTSVPQTADNPASGVSGMDTGTVTGGPKRYYAYGVADQDSVKTYSVSISESGATPTGVTNYRLIGSVTTDINNNFTSRDLVTVHGVSERELVGAYAVFNGAASVLGVSDAFNVSGLVDNGTGDYTVTIDRDFNTADFVSIMNGKRSGATTMLSCMPQTLTAGTARHNCVNQSDAANDGNPIMYIALGDNRQ